MANEDSNCRRIDGCYNCKRFGVAPGQLIKDTYSNIFCSTDCGWSYLMRPKEEQDKLRNSPRTQRPSARAAEQAKQFQNMHAQRRQAAAPKRHRSHHTNRHESQAQPTEGGVSSRTESSDRAARAARKKMTADALERGVSLAWDRGVSHAMYEFDQFSFDTE